MTKKRTAKTRTGQKVYLGLYEVPGGWEGWTLNAKGHAVLVFVPAKEDE